MVRRNRLLGKRREKLKPICETSGGLKEDSPPPPGKKPKSDNHPRSPPQEVGQNSGGGLEEAPTQRPAKAKYRPLIERLGLKKPETIEEMDSVGSKIARALCNDPYSDYRPYGGGEVLDMKLIRKYLKQVKKSDGFDVDVYPGPCPAVTFIPVTDLKTDPDIYKDLFEMATLALDEFNEDSSEGVRYELVEIERATFFPCAGDIYHITFRAREAETDNIKTFQAKIYDGIEDGDRDVMLVRMKS